MTRKHLEREYEQFWSQDMRGRVVIAIQYHKSGSPGDFPENRPDNRPIYVGFDGEEPRDLTEILEENKQLKNSQLSQLDTKLDQLDKFQNRIIELQSLITSKRLNKKWWEFWK